MTVRSLVIVAMALLLVGCGGGQPPPTSGTGTIAPGTNTAASTPAPTVAAGEPIGSPQVRAAVDELMAQPSWQFEVTAITMGLSEGVEQSIAGTHRTTPETASDATHIQPQTGEEFRYIRIGDSIWYDVGTGTFTEIQADNAENLIEQYEPYYLNGLSESMLSQDYLWEPVGNEVVSGIDTTHYSLSEDDREDITQLLDIEPSQWAGDVWIANDGGFVMRLMWGPQELEVAQLSTGFDYLVTAVNCECPIEPPI